jgi:hypothetical protein
MTPGLKGLIAGSTLAVASLGISRFTQVQKLTQPLNNNAFAVKKFTPQIVTRNDIAETTVKGLDDNALYNIGIARKNIFLFSHAAIALQPVTQQTDENKLIIIGRQSPADAFSSNKQDNQESWSQWLYNKTIGRLTTEIENEKGYNFFPSIPYKVELLPSEIAMSGKEIKQVVDHSNNVICKTQSFNLAQSNCYSAATTLVANMMTKVNSRPTYPSQTNDLSSIYDGLLMPLVKDNFSQGVSNNFIASLSIFSAQALLRKYHLIGNTQSDTKKRSTP